jgi:hypothetical protein
MSASKIGRYKGVLWTRAKFGEIFHYDFDAHYNDRFFYFIRNNEGRYTGTHFNTLHDLKRSVDMYPSIREEAK